MASPNNAVVLHVSLYVAAAIVEHGKRRKTAAGYLFGTRTTEAIHLTDYVPLTHVRDLSDTTSKAYAQERNNRVASKRSFTKTAMIGWYVATEASDIDPAVLEAWGDAPAVTFGGNGVARHAVFVRCSLPTEACMKVKWEAFATSTTLVATQEKHARPVIASLQKFPLGIRISAGEDNATNAILHHVTSLVMYNGKRSYNMSGLVNLDSIAFDARTHKKSPADALLEVRKKLLTAVDEANNTLAAADAPAAKKAEAAEFMDAVKVIRKMKEDQIEQQQSASAREDFNNQRFKDALMIKCMSVLMRKEVTQLEILASQYPDGNKNSTGVFNRA